MEISETRIVDWIDTIISQAISRCVSDIHFEPFADHLRVRMRKDGILLTVASVSSDHSSQIIGRLQVLARIDTTQKRVAHDSKFIVRFQERYVDIRVSSFPVVHGQKVVLRILDTLLHNISLNSIGFEQSIHDQLLMLLNQRNGLIIVTGPTGSGKTTTLYGCLRYLNSVDQNIVTLEDPVEYSLPGIMQSPISSDLGFTFAQGIRSILRQDPDVVMVGEIRDYQTARAAIEAALTGHLVLTTLHTIDAPSAIIRLMDMGIEPYLLRGTLLGIIGQRLVKKMCVSCSVFVSLSSIELQDLGLSAIHDVIEARGCDACNNVGYAGRLGLFELLVCNDSLKAVIDTNLSLSLLKKVALKNGWVSLISDAQKKLESHTIDLKQYYSIIQNSM